MTTATVATSLRLTHGFHASEFDRLVRLLGSLDRRLESFRDDRVELHLGVKERDTDSQRMVLEAVVAGRPTMVATSELSDLDEAVIEVRDDLIRQISDDKHRREPKNNRQLREQ